MEGKTLYDLVPWLEVLKVSRPKAVVNPLFRAGLTLKEVWETEDALLLSVRAFGPVTIKYLDETLPKLQLWAFLECRGFLPLEDLRGEESNI